MNGFIKKKIILKIIKNTLSELSDEVFLRN